MKITDLAGSTPEEMLTRLKRAQRALEHRLTHCRSVLQDMEDKHKAIKIMAAPNHVGIQGTSTKSYIERIPQNEDLIAAYTKASHEHMATQKAYQRNLTTQKDVMKQAVAPSTVTGGTQIPVAQIPKTIPDSRSNHATTINNPYFYSATDQYAGPPEGYNWDATAAVEYFKLKQMMQKYGLKFDVVYASQGESGHPTFLAVGGHGDILYYRRPTKDRAARIIVMGVTHKASNLGAWKKGPLIERGIQKVAQQFKAPLIHKQV